MKISIADLKNGEKAKILGFNTGNRSYQSRLLALGLVPNTIFTMIRSAPFGDPIEIRIQNSSVCLRKNEVAILQIERFSK
jgi:ferrous iron transport protein A